MNGGGYQKGKQHMANFIKSLIGYEGTKATPEEIEAYRIANEALQYRVRNLVRGSYSPDHREQPVTDRFGRSLH